MVASSLVNADVLFSLIPDALTIFHQHSKSRVILHKNMKCNHQPMCCVQMMIQMMGIFFSAFPFCLPLLLCHIQMQPSLSLSLSFSLCVLPTLFTIINNAQKNLIFASIEMLGRKLWT